MGPTRLLPEAVEELDWEMVYLALEPPHWGEKLHEEIDGQRPRGTPVAGPFAAS